MPFQESQCLFNDEINGLIEIKAHTVIAIFPILILMTHHQMNIEVFLSLETFCTQADHFFSSWAVPRMDSDGARSPLDTAEPETACTVLAIDCMRPLPCIGNSVIIDSNRRVCYDSVITDSGGRSNGNGGGPRPGIALTTRDVTTNAVSAQQKA